MKTARGALAPNASSRPWWAEMMHNRIIALVLAMIVIVPLFASPADRSKTGMAALTLEAFALVLMTALLWRAQWDLRGESVQRFLKTSANLPILLLTGLVVLSGAMHQFNVLSSQEVLRMGAGVMLYFVAAYQFRQSKHLSLLASTLLLLGLLVSFGGLVEYQLFSEDRARALFGDPQPLASLLMILVPVVAALAATDKSARRRVVAQIALVLMVGCLLLTQVRSAWLGSIAGLATLAWLATRPLPGQKPVSLSLQARKYQLVAPLMFVLITGGFLVLMNAQNGTIAQRAQTFGKLGTDVSWQSRLQKHWSGAFKMIEQHPITGVGTGLFPAYQHDYTHQGVAVSPSGEGIRISLAEQAHNFYLQTAAELGLPGLLLTLAVLITFLVAGFKRVRTMEPGVRRTLLMGSLGATIAFMVDAVGSPSWQYGQTAMFLWLTMGVGTSCLRPRVKREEEVVAIHAVSRRATWLTRPVAVAAMLCIATFLPSVQASAADDGYNDGGDGGTSTGTKVARIAIGTAAVGAIGYGLYALYTSIAGGAASGAAAGAAGAGSAGGSDVLVGAAKTGAVENGGSVLTPVDPSTLTPTDGAAPQPTPAS